VLKIVGMVTQRNVEVMSDSSRGKFIDLLADVIHTYIYNCDEDLCSELTPWYKAFSSKVYL